MRETECVLKMNIAAVTWSCHPQSVESLRDLVDFKYDDTACMTETVSHNCLFYA